MPYVSIIIPTYHDWQRLKLCLEALVRQVYDRDQFEIIVVNNDPGDKLPDKFFLPFNCILLDEPRKSSYAARNKALEIAKGVLIGFTDSDCIPDKNWIANAVRIFEQNGEIQRIGGTIELFFKGQHPNWAELYDWVFAFPQKTYVQEYGWAATANAFARREVFNTIGHFNAALQSGGDFEWGERAAKQQSRIVFAENAIVKHPARSGVRELLKKARRVGIGEADVAILRKERNRHGLLKQLYIIFRWRTEDLPKIRERLKLINRNGMAVWMILFLRNLVLAYSDYSGLW